MSLLPLNRDQHDSRPPNGDFGDLFRFTGAVGPEAANTRDDVIRAQILLGQTGDLDLGSLGGPTGWPGGELTRGLKRYQRRKGLTVDGLMLPDGETITALQDDLYDRLARYRTPTTAEVERFHDRLARYRTEGSDDVKRPRIELERLDGGTLTSALRSGADTPQSSGVQSDIDFDQSPTFTPGAQVAQVAPPVHPAAGIAGIAGATQQPYGVTPEAAKAGRQIEKWFDEKVNLLSLPWQMYQGLTNGQSPATSSPSIDPEIESGSKTPPLIPSSPEKPTDYLGGLLAEGTRALESGIQDIFGTTVERHETENTKLSSDIIVEECNKLIGENIRLHGFEHIAGASKDGEEFPEKAVKDKKLGGGGGHSFPDVLYQRAKEELVGINSATESSPGRYIGRESSSFERLVENIGKWAAAMTGKKRKDEDLEDYRKRARAVCEEAFGKFHENEDRKAKNIDAETP